MLAIFCGNTFVHAEVAGTEAVANDGNKPTYNFYQNYSHWSIAVSGGFNLLLCERNDEATGKIENYKNNFLGQFNAEVEYSFNPTWGVALNYAYAPISRKAIFPVKGMYDVNPESNGQGHQVYAMLNVNLLSLFRRYRSHAEWGWYAGVGAGAYMFNTCMQMFEPIDGQEIPWSTTVMIPLETRVEYSPIPSIGIFLKAGLDFYLDDRINVCSFGQLCDWNVYTGVGLRWNIGASKKESVRTIDMNTFEGGSGRRASSKDNDDDNEKKVVANPASEEQLAELQRQIDQLQAQIANMQNIPATTTAVETPAVDQTTTVNPAAAPADNSGRLANVEKLAAKNEADIKDIRTELSNLRAMALQSNDTKENSVYFDHGSALVTKEYELVIARVAKMMIAEPSLRLEITSFCSSTGDETTNTSIGEKRIDAVRYILINRYRIDANRVRAQYKGQVNDQFESVNRRCDLNFK